MATRDLLDRDPNTDLEPVPDLNFESQPTVVGDLDSEQPIYKYVVGNVVHLVGVNCEAMASQAAEPRRTTAATMWDDTPICRFCAARATADSDDQEREQR